MQNKKLLIGVIILAVVIIGGIGAYVVLGMNSGGGKVDENGEESLVDESAKTVTADEIGLTLTPTQNNQVLMMEITKLDGIKSIDYEVSYDALENGEVVPRGAIGFIELAGESTIERKIDLGTCSRNICKYDKGVENVKVVLRINYADGTTGALEEEVTLE